MPQMGQWPQIMATKMHKNLAFSGTKFQIFWEGGTASSPESFGILFLEMLHFGAF